MIFRRAFLEGIQTGTVTLAFRRWQRPTVRPGGTLLTPLGQLHIGAITRVTLDEVSAADARRAGYASRDALIDELEQRRQGVVYRIELGPLRADPRVALRETPLADEDDVRKLQARLARLDAAAERPWTIRVLELLRAFPGVRAGDLCVRLGQEKEPFKINVRKLKALGLTESLEVGYRLSPRGAALLDRLRGGRGQAHNARPRPR